MSAWVSSSCVPKQVFLTSWSMTFGPNNFDVGLSLVLQEAQRQPWTPRTRCQELLPPLVVWHPEQWPDTPNVSLGKITLVEGPVVESVNSPLNSCASHQKQRPWGRGAVKSTYLRPLVSRVTSEPANHHSELRSVFFLVRSEVRWPASWILEMGSPAKLTVFTTHGLAEYFYTHTLLSMNRLKESSQTVTGWGPGLEPKWPCLWGSRFLAVWCPGLISNLIQVKHSTKAVV